MCSGASVTAKDSREKAELSQGGKWEESGKIAMTRYYFWINSIVKTPPVSTQALFYEREQSVFKYRYEPHLPGEAPERFRGGALWGKICKYCFKKKRQKYLDF